MKKDITFGECLANLLEAYKMKSSKLAKGINVDSSLIYKWLRNERVPSYNSPYIELIVNFLAKNINNSYQKKIIADAVINYGSELSEAGDSSIMERIHTMLLEAQGYSIEIHNKERPPQKKMPVPSVERLLKSMDQSAIKQSRIYCNSYKQSIQRFKDSDSKLGTHLACSSDIIKIFKGHKEILFSALDLFKRSPEKPKGADDTILITLNSSIDLLPEHKEFNLQWKHTLCTMLNNGWKIIVLIKLDNNIVRTVKIIESMQLALTTGNFHIYYCKHSTDNFIGNELFIIPPTGALCCFSSNSRHQNAFLYNSKASIDALSDHFLRYCASATPLLHAYPSQKATEFQQVLTETEEIFGDRYVFEAGPGAITIPPHLYQKYLSNSGKNNQELSFRMYLHKRRLAAFNMQVKYYMYKEIWIKESIEKLVYEHKYSFDDQYIFGNITPSNADIASHLENIINMLEIFENYEVAIVSEKEYDNVSKLYWTVKSNCSVLIETPDNRNNGLPDSDCYGSAINFSITEKEVVRAFYDYFLITWNRIHDEKKNKKMNIEWLKSLITIVRNT